MAGPVVPSSEQDATSSHLADVIRALSPYGMDASDFEQRVRILQAIKGGGAEAANMECGKFRCSWF